MFQMSLREIKIGAYKKRGCTPEDLSYCEPRTSDPFTPVLYNSQYPKGFHTHFSWRIVCSFGLSLVSLKLRQNLYVAEKNCAQLDHEGGVRYLKFFDEPSVALPHLIWDGASNIFFEGIIKLWDIYIY